MRRASLGQLILSIKALRLPGSAAQMLATYPYLYLYPYPCPCPYPYPYPYP